MGEPTIEITKSQLEQVKDWKSGSKLWNLIYDKIVLEIKVLNQSSKFCRGYEEALYLKGKAEVLEDITDYMNEHIKKAREE